MDDTTAATLDETTTDTAPRHGTEVEPEVADELLVEEISIDGMCGVY